jgi:iron complex outermembrane receptor protein
MELPMHLAQPAPGDVRYDQVGDFDPAFNPRLALIYNPWEKSTFKAIYGTAFRAPNFTELGDPRFQNIKPEEITSASRFHQQDMIERDGRSFRPKLTYRF